MILYTLVCADGHRFDSWFRDSAAYDDQSDAGHLACPVCSSGRVAKAVMAPALVGQRSGTAVRDATDQDRTIQDTTAKATTKKDTTGKHTIAKDPTSTDTPAREVALLDPGAREIRALLRKVREKVLAEGHDVGPRFAAEARRIHDGEAPNRQIYGQASVGEARELIDDGILVLPLPIVPDELN